MHSGKESSSKLKQQLYSHLGIGMSKSLFSHPMTITHSLDPFFEPSKKIVPSKGRRAVVLNAEKENAEKNQPQSSAAGSQSETIVLPAENVAQPVTADEPPMIPSKRRHTWEDKPQKEVVDSRLITHDESDDDNFPAIPELEDFREDPMEYDIAAPATLTTELLSYRELDSDLMKQSAFQILDNEIDMKILTKAIIPEKETLEPDETWEMEKLFAEIKSSMMKCDKNTSDTNLETVVTDREVLI